MNQSVEVGVQIISSVNSRAKDLKLKTKNLPGLNLNNWGFGAKPWRDLGKHREKVSKY